MEISATISSFVTHVKVEKGLSPNTVEAYRRDLVKFEAFAKKRKLTLETVSRDDLVDFLAGLYREKLESRTVARHLVTLRNFFRFAQIQDLISDDPTINLESPKIRRTLPGYLRLEEVEKLLNQPDQKTALGMRDRAMLEVLYSTGLRVSELVGLRIGDLDSKMGCVRASAKVTKNGSCRSGESAGDGREVFARGAARAAEEGEAVAEPGAVCEPARGVAEPCGRVEDFVGVWAAGGFARGADAAHVAAQFCDAFAGTRRGFAVGAIDVGPRGYFHDADLYACCRGAVEADLQGASSRGA